MRIWKLGSDRRNMSLTSAKLICLLIVGSLAFAEGAAVAGSPARTNLASADTATLKARRATPKRLAPSRRLVAPTTKTTLKITQLSKTALVPLHWYKTVPCPDDPSKTCYTHTLKSKGNLNLKIRIAFTCPSGKHVKKLYYKKGNKTITVAQNLNTNFIVKTVNIQPWTANDFLNQCRKRFGNPSKSLVPKGNGASLMTTMQYGLNVYGKCSGQKTTYKFQVLKVKTTCDTDFVPAG